MAKEKDVAVGVAQKKTPKKKVKNKHKKKALTFINAFFILLNKIIRHPQLGG